MFSKGDTFDGPDGQGYTLTHDLTPGVAFTTSTFEPFGGAPRPEGGEPIPAWLLTQLKAPE